MVKNVLDVLDVLWRNLRDRGFEYQVSRSFLIAEIKRATHVISDRAVANALRVLVELGYVKQISPGVFELCVDLSHPYEFMSDRLGGEVEGVGVSTEASES